MYQHVWYRKLRQLNPRLKVCQFESSRHLPGIYYVDEREGIVDICATDKEWVPAAPAFDTRGQMVKSGYRRVIQILLSLNLTTRSSVRREFPGFFESHYPVATKTQIASIHQQWTEMMRSKRQKFNIIGDAKQVDVQDRIVDKMKQMEIDNFNRRSSAALSGDQFMELAEDIKADMPDHKKENLDRAKFAYDKATGRIKSIS